MAKPYCGAGLNQLGTTNWRIPGPGVRTNKRKSNRPSIGALARMSTAKRKVPITLAKVNLPEVGS